MASLLVPSRSAERGLRPNASNGFVSCNMGAGSTHRQDCITKRLNGTSSTIQVEDAMPVTLWLCLIQPLSPTSRPPDVRGVGPGPRTKSPTLLCTSPAASSLLICTCFVTPTPASVTASPATPTPSPLRPPRIAHILPDVTPSSTPVPITPSSPQVTHCVLCNDCHMVRLGRVWSQRHEREVSIHLQTKPHGATVSQDFVNRPSHR